jgi:hypothetical protein
MLVLLMVSVTPAPQGLQKAANDTGCVLCVPPAATLSCGAVRVMLCGVLHRMLGWAGLKWWALEGLGGLRVLLRAHANSSASLACAD